MLLTEQDKCCLARIVYKDHKQAIEEITEEFNQTLNVLMSKRTIQHTLHSIGYYGHTGRKKPLVSEVNKEKCLF